MKIREKKDAQGKMQKNKYSLRTRLRGWFHHGRFIGFDIQSIIMAVLTGLTITTTVVMGFLIYNRFKLAIKQTAVSNAESMIESTVDKVDTDLAGIRQISNGVNYNIIQEYDISSQEFSRQFSLLYEVNVDKVQSMALYDNSGKLVAAATPFSFGEFEMFEGRSSYTVVMASIQNYFREVQEELEATYYGCYFLEFADYYCQENNDEREMLKLLYQSLRALTSAAYDKRLVRFIFELKAMAVNGEAPNVFSCVRCGEKENLRWFMTRRGGCICETCEKKDPSPEESGRFLLEESTLYTMQYIISARVEKLYTFSVSDSVLRQLLAIMKSYRAVYLDHSFQTLKMLEGLFTG